MIYLLTMFYFWISLFSFVYILPLSVLTSNNCSLAYYNFSTSLLFPLYLDPVKYVDFPFFLFGNSWRHRLEALLKYTDNETKGMPFYCYCNSVDVINSQMVG